MKPKPEIEIPLNLKTERFEEIWEEWKQHRKEIHHTLKPTTEKRQLKKLSKVGEEKAICMIENSIEQGYTGLFPPKDKPVNGCLELLVPIREAYQKVYGESAPLPSQWQLRIAALYEAGETERLKALADPSFIRQGRTMASMARCADGIGWVEKAIDDYGAKEMSKSRTWSKEIDAAVAEATRVVKENDRERVELFKKLDRDERVKWMAKAVEKFPKMNEESLLRMAALEWEKSVK